MFDLLDQYRVNELHVRDDAATGLKAFIAIHNTRFGPALGGCRFIPYDSSDNALLDAVRLARGMSYKAVLAGVPQGGGKAVIMKPPGSFDGEALFRSFGRFVQDLGGRYITAVDAGTSAREMDWICKETQHVTSTSTEDNPAVYTARGVFEGIGAAIRHQLGQDHLQGLKVAVQGIGNVGYRLCEMLHQAGAELIISDINEQQTRRAAAAFGAKVVAPEAIYAVPCDAFAPCGLGGILNEQTLPQLNCRVVAGSANNQLASAQQGRWLHEQGILYAPDYVINAGGLVYASLHHLGKAHTLIEEKTKRIAHTLTEIFRQSAQKDLATSAIADALAEKRLYQTLSEAA